MNSFLEKLKPADVIACIVLTGGFFLTYKGINHVVSGMMIGVTTYYFVNKKYHDYPKIEKPLPGDDTE